MEVKIAYLQNSTISATQKMCVRRVPPLDGSPQDIWEITHLSLASKKSKKSKHSQIFAIESTRLNVKFW